MSALLTLENDAGSSITSFNWGAIQDGNSAQYKFKVKNTGDQDALSVLIKAVRTSNTDGVDLALLALDYGGNPGSFSAGPLNLDTMTPGTEIAFWVKVTVPTGTTPQGNPRQFDVKANYSGT